MNPMPQSGPFLDTRSITFFLGLTPGLRVAHLGCGSGYFTLEMAHAVGKDGVVTAVDIRQDPLDQVRAKVDAAGLANVREVRADLEVPGATGIPDNSQDLALLANVLFQSSKKDAMIREAFRMTKSGGHVVVIDWKKGMGGFGPADDLRTSEEDIKALVQTQGGHFDRPLEVGRFSYGLVFTKQS